MQQLLWIKRNYNIKIISGSNEKIIDVKDKVDKGQKNNRINRTIANNKTGRILNKSTDKKNTNNDNLTNANLNKPIAKTLKNKNTHKDSNSNTNTNTNINISAINKNSNKTDQNINANTLNKTEKTEKSDKTEIADINNPKINTTTTTNNPINITPNTLSNPFNPALIAKQKRNSKFKNNFIPSQSPTPGTSPIHTYDKTNTNKNAPTDTFTSLIPCQNSIKSLRKESTISNNKINSKIQSNTNLYIVSSRVSSNTDMDSYIPIPIKSSKNTPTVHTLPIHKIDINDINNNYKTDFEDMSPISPISPNMKMEDIDEIIKANKNIRRKYAKTHTERSYTPLSQKDKNKLIDFSVTSKKRLVLFTELFKEIRSQISHISSSINNSSVDKSVVNVRSSMKEIDEEGGDMSVDDKVAHLGVGLDADDLILPKTRTERGLSDAEMFRKHESKSFCIRDRDRDRERKKNVRNNNVGNNNVENNLNLNLNNNDHNLSNLNINMENSMCLNMNTSHNENAITITNAINSVNNLGNIGNVGGNIDNVGGNVGSITGSAISTGINQLNNQVNNVNKINHANHHIKSSGNHGFYTNPSNNSNLNLDNLNSNFTFKSKKTYTNESDHLIAEIDENVKEVSVPKNRYNSNYLKEFDMSELNKINKPDYYSSSEAVGRRYNNSNNSSNIIVTNANTNTNTYTNNTNDGM